MVEARVANSPNALLPTSAVRRGQAIHADVLAVLREEARQIAGVVGVELALHDRDRIQGEVS